MGLRKFDITLEEVCEMSGSDVKTMLENADVPLSGSLAGMQSSLTERGVTVSVVVPHAIGDHFEVTLSSDQINLRT